jgi:hypothetical protein
VPTGHRSYTHEVDPAAARRLLGLPPGASPGQIEAAFRVQVRSAHPDRGGDAERFQRVVEARRVLLAPRRSSHATLRPARPPAQVQFAPSSSLLRQVAVIVIRRLAERRQGPRPRRVI